MNKASYPYSQGTVNFVAIKFFLDRTRPWEAKLCYDADFPDERTPIKF